MKNDESAHEVPPNPPLSFTDRINLLEAELQSVKQKSANELQGVRRKLEEATTECTRAKRSELNLRERILIYQRAMAITEQLLDRGDA